MPYLDLKSHKFYEYVDNVKVIHTGEFLQSKCFDGSIKIEEILDMYDLNGNKFYSNYSSVEEAEVAIKELAKEGITAIIGPRAPWRHSKTGLPMKNLNENNVGLYIVSVPKIDTEFFMLSRRKK